MKRRTIFGVFWVGVYLILTLAPLFALLIGPRPPGRGFWTDFSVALGFAGLAMMGFQFLLTARFARVTSPYGIDVIYHFHRQISIMAFFLLLAHPIILFIRNPALLRLLNVTTAPWQAQAGVVSLIALSLLIVTSAWRIRLRIPYEPWRFAHIVFSILAVALGIAHVVGVGYYVDELWKSALWITLGLGWISALLYVRVIKPSIMLRRPYVVDEVIQQPGKTWTLVLKPEGHRGLRFLPGQFAWLTIWSSPFAIQEHPFSFSSSAVTQGNLHLTVKELGDFTSRMNEVRVGETAYLDGPYGSFTTDMHIASRYIFFAGGIGITPIMSILRTMADRRDNRELLLFYASKTWETTAFLDDLEELSKRLHLRVVHVLEKPHEGWQGESGFINARMIVPYLPDDREDIQCFVCGPVPMMNAIEDALIRLGLPVEKAQSERFNLV